MRAAADAARLGQAILNLAHNAVKYSHPVARCGSAGGRSTAASGSRSPTTGSGSRPRTSSGSSNASTRSIGRAPPIAPRHRARPGAGWQRGLGLAIVRHIAEAHGGAVGLTSEEGTGSTFWIEVPVAA